MCPKYACNLSLKMNDQTTEAIQQLNNTISTKESYDLKFTSNDSSYTTRFITPIKINPNRKYECALQYFSTSNYQINITEKIINLYILIMQLIILIFLLLFSHGQL